MKRSNAPRKRLPVNPSLEYLQKQAKRRVKLTPSLKLAKAQHQLAQEYGCKNWAELARVVQSMGRTAKELTPRKDFNPLPDAANDGDIDKVRAILAKGEFTQHDLDLALSRGTWNLSRHPERRVLGKLLLEHGADPDGQYGSNYGPIILSPCEGLDPEGIEFLIKAGADVSFGPFANKYASDNTPMNAVLSTYARGRNEAKHRCIDLLIKHGAQWEDDVIMDIHRGNAEGLAERIRKDRSLIGMHFGSQPNARTNGNISLRGATLLHLAVEFGERECVKVLLDHHADLNAPSEIIDGIGGQTPVFHAVATWALAVQNESPDLLETLLQKGARTDVKATFRLFGEVIEPALTPLEYALRGIDETKASPAKQRELQLLRGADRKTQLKEAIRHEQAEEAVRLLNTYPDLLDIDLWPVAIFQAKSLAMTQLLLDRGLDPNRCSAPRKPLHLAATRKLPKVVEILLEGGADPNITDGEGFMPLDLYGGLIPGPRDEEDQKIIAQLLAAGAKPNLWTWIRLGETEHVLRLLKEAPSLIHAKSPDLQFLPLHVAARMANVPVVRYLIEHGADVNAGENTALWFAAQSGAEPAVDRIEIMKLLLNAGADVNRRCEEGSTALHYAAWRGPVEAVELLLSREARNWIEDHSGKLPRDYATGSNVSPDKEAIIRLFSTPRIDDPNFQAAVDAMSAGDLPEVQVLLRKHPYLSKAQAEEEGWYAGPYFKHPYLLEFVAENPIRTRKLPPNIHEIAQFIIDTGVNPEALDKTIGLVASGCVPRECGVQTLLLELLVKNGALPSKGLEAALMHGEKEASETLIRLGAVPDFFSSACLGLIEKIERALARESLSRKEKEQALHGAIRYGQLAVVRLLLEWGINLQDEILDYGTPLHYAALFGQKEIAAWMVAEGADVRKKDTQWQGTPAGWAHHNGKPEIARWLGQLEKDQ